MVKRAIAVHVKADRDAPKPGDRVEFTFTVTNAGAGHKTPTGDPDRFFTVEFMVEDRQGNVLAQQRSTMGRWILWQPAIVELYDNRLLPQGSREYQFAYRLPDKADGLKLRALVRYHILTDAQHEMLRTKYGLTGDDPYRFVVYEREFPLSGDLRVALETERREVPGISHRRDVNSCRATADS
jgi:hypothetical protein